MAEIKVELIDVMGNDLTVVNAARVSFDKESEELTQKDEKLIGYLARHEHWTPFAHPQITLRETIPIFVARQRFKHTVGFVYNEVSRRYVDDVPSFYVPSAWRGRPDGSVKQGSGDTLLDEVVVYDRLLPTDAYMLFLDHAQNLYEGMIQAGIAPEQARMVLPQSMMTSYYVTGSLAAFARAYKQRTDQHAQKEIRDLAVEWDNIIRNLFPVAWAALVDD